MTGLEAVRHITFLTKIIVLSIYSNLKAEAMKTGSQESIQIPGCFLFPHLPKTTPKTYISIEDNPGGLLLRSKQEFNPLYFKGGEGCQK